MGYCSDIRIRVRKRDYKKFNNFVEEFLEQHEDEINTIINKYREIGIEKDREFNFNSMKDITYYAEDVIEKEIVFGWDYVKWYENTYLDVKAIMYALSKFDELHLPYHYFRIGEDYDDIEEKYTYDSMGKGVFDIRVIRKFEDKLENEIKEQ